MEIVTENAVTLAWLGDALMNTYVREHLLSQGWRRVDDLQKKAPGISPRRLRAACSENLKKMVSLQRMKRLY